MTTVTVRYIANGYTVNWSGSQAIGVPASLYAAVLPEVVYWLGRIFDPVTQPAPQQQKGSAQPHAIVADDPLLGQQAQVIDIASGGFLVTQIPGIGSGAKFVEVFAPTMDQVAQLLTIIYTPPSAQRETTGDERAPEKR